MSECFRILFVGDSLTEWFDLSKYFPGLPVWNEGIAGDTTYGLLERLDSIMEQPADNIFLMIGINDILNGFHKDDIIENQQLIIEEIQTQSNYAKLIVQSLLPVNESMMGSPGYLNSLIRCINKQLREDCEARKITYLDLFTDFLSGDEMSREYTTDGAHLSEAGYQLWAEKIQAFLR